MSNATAEASITTTWPAGFQAHKKGVGGFAVREVQAPADAVFAWVRRIDAQGPYYQDLKYVKSYGGPWPELGKGSKVAFLIGATFVPFVRVIECDAQARRLAWGGNLPGLSICHAFTVQAIDDQRSLIRSEELWVGPIATATAALIRPQIQKVQTRWAEGIVLAAEAHPAGPATA